MTGSSLPLVVVDAANVVGSTPDGWWRDRHGATERLRDRLSGLAASGLGEIPGPVEVVMVVEGQARTVVSSPTVTTVSAPGSGDDRIVEVVAEHDGRRCVVVTADRELRRRVAALGADVLGPSTLAAARRR
ncbi:hypothetical protein [Gordonia rhizosphera]|uniref:NTP pyrophosphohydrolase n=1 Tax=Gordonia rhizosphera NBRC 16068 TaxID=1108045 RepID=K6WE60_9ACTN|nr:hypothetical protein [Gordonia rhizosphera]GAB90477.1 hypothetical protein GORHZ_104_00060 [Gordonia rhizosphera NBRC 16068]